MWFFSSVFETRTTFFWKKNEDKGKGLMESIPLLLWRTNFDISTETQSHLRSWFFFFLFRCRPFNLIYLYSEKIFFSVRYRWNAITNATPKITLFSSIFFFHLFHFIVFVFYSLSMVSIEDSRRSTEVGERDRGLLNELLVNTNTICKGLCLMPLISFFFHTSPSRK